MKALSLIQPWASLVALGEKKIETRSWRTNYRGELLIHASRKIDTIMYREPFFSALKNQLIISSELPTGVMIASCKLMGCLKIVRNDGDCAYLEDGSRIWGNEYHFGDYTPGRWAWILEDIKPIKPIPAKGKLSIWDWDGVIEFERVSEVD
jgi:hypothetical protein